MSNFKSKSVIVDVEFETQAPEDAPDEVVEDNLVLGLPVSAVSASPTPAIKKARTTTPTATETTSEGEPANNADNEAGVPTAPSNDARILMVSTTLLKAHPKNAKIYGVEPEDEDLQKSITIQGVLEPLIAGEDNILVAGHRRLRAAKAAGLPRVPVIFRKFKDHNNHLRALIESNLQRKKSNEVLGREVLFRKELESQLAKLRKGQRGDETTAPGEKGSARDNAGKHYGLSGVTADHLIVAVNEIDRLDAEKKPEEAEKLRKILNEGSIDAAYKEAIKTATKAASKSKRDKKEETPLAAEIAKQQTAKEPARVSNEKPMTHDEAMKSLEQVIAHVEDLKDEDMTDGKRTEWREMMESLATALADAGISES